MQPTHSGRPGVGRKLLEEAGPQPRSADVKSSALRMQKEGLRPQSEGTPLRLWLENTEKVEGAGHRRLSA